MEDHLTNVGTVTKEMVHRTVPGMAHWAGTGPLGKTCGECVSYILREIGLGKAPRCAKYRQLTGLWGTKRIAVGTPSCRHFEQRETNGA